MAGGQGGGSGGRGGLYGQPGGNAYFGSFGGGGGGGGAGQSGGAGDDRDGNRVYGGSQPGGAGQDATGAYQGGGGGAGGSFGNAGAPIGGAGGRGGNGVYGGGGGAGGYGLVASDTFTNSGTVRGGVGGDGGTGSSTDGGGAGGDGGVGLYVTAPSNTPMNNQGRIYGGNGGSGGNGAYGGAGGDGVRSATGSSTALSFTNSGNVYGGNGIAGGNGVTGNNGSYVYNAGVITAGNQTGAAPDNNNGGGGGIRVGDDSRVINTGSVYGGSAIAGQGGNGIYARSGSYVYSSSIVRGGDSGGRIAGSGIFGYKADIRVVDGTVAGGNGATYGGAGVVGIYGSVAVEGGTVTGGNGAFGEAGIYGFGATVTVTGGSVAGGNSTVDPGTAKYAGVGSGVLGGGKLTLVSNTTISGGTFGGARLNAVTFLGGSNTLAIGDKAVFNGAVEVRSIQDPSGSTTAGTLTFDQSKGTGFSADATLSANLIGDGGIIKAGRGTLTLSGTGNTFSGGTIIQSGAIDLAAAGAGGTGAISFQGRGAQATQLILETSAQNIGATFGSTLDSFGNGDSLDLRGLTFSTSTTVTYDSKGHILTVSNGSITERFTLTNEMPGANNMFYAQRDATGTGTLISNTVCYGTGTRIRTTLGLCAVENLVAGDIVVTASGETRPVVWIGHRDTDCRGLPDLHPVRVAAHGFGAGLPARDLYLSPGHPVLVGAKADGEGGHLVPIMCLINGTTIERVAVDQVTYWHVELDAHDILLAEGLPAESYIDLGSRPWFAGTGGALYDPDMALPGMPGRCRPVAIDGSVVDAERRRLDMVFATRLASACAWPSAGDGWAADVA